MEASTGKNRECTRTYRQGNNFLNRISVAQKLRKRVDK
jgi:hypothetical protein